ncbi:ubiquitin C-terminal hydrolase [Ophiocordyceps camponoti-floridani]|uniref:Ubiquitin carboxyl-terminal hydrolase n=1 Tax=Ophiocordyceps camponoti-floridani TaxID=2030778 RepID=A0A8H4Q276_9HYPO|nr:ubiquitin C-terminal hydrolase [Ophiocordyceps camponoti-floridani]
MSGGGPGPGPGGGPGPGPRRRGQPQYGPPYHHQHHHHHHHHQQMVYGGYIPYAHQGYYGMPPQFQNGAMPSPAYVTYPGYTRSPPSMPQYVPLVGVSTSSTYPARHSPSLSTAYQPPPAPASIPPHTPSSSHSSQILHPPTPPTPQTADHGSTGPSPSLQLEGSLEQRESFRPPIPWYSCAESDFPIKTPRSKRRRKPLTADGVTLSLPLEKHASLAEQSAPSPSEVITSSDLASKTSHPKSGPPTPQAGLPVLSGATTGDAAPATVDRPAIPAVPVIPAVPRTMSKASGAAEIKKQAADASKISNGATSTACAESAPVSPPPRLAPTSWANLFSKPAVKEPSAASEANGSSTANGPVSPAVTAPAPGRAFSKSNATLLAEAIRAYRVGGTDTVPFLEPRGLINTGNMCYMNSVLQVLIFCTPFFDFLDQVSKRAAYSFKSETPLIDAMIMFLHEYKVLASAPTTSLLRRKLKSDDLEKYGEPFTPEFVYEAIRQLPRFASMRRGHQQDAEEFLGFLLQSLDDECTKVLSSLPSTDSDTASVDMAASQTPAANSPGDWLEVGRKQRAAVTRSSGSNSSTPVTKIFGGLLRSEFRVPGLKDSITTEPYQPLQLDIGSPDVRNVIDALRGLTRPERLQGDFNSPRGKDVTATKQVFIESLPPVLILHLKRFQFDAEGHGTIKVWKKIGYPLELEIPREAVSRQKRHSMGDGAMPKYRLVSVVYHHGRNASGGHYTVDVRRQDGLEWIRMDDTVLRRVRSEDVAEGGSEEDPREGRKDGGMGASANRFGVIDDEEAGDDDEGWKQVTASASGSKRWSSVVNGNSGNGNIDDKQQLMKESLKDSKVAYLLFYQRM